MITHFQGKQFKTEKKFTDYPFWQIIFFRKKIETAFRSFRRQTLKVHMSCVGLDNQSIIIVFCNKALVNVWGFVFQTTRTCSKADTSLKGTVVLVPRVSALEKLDCTMDGRKKDTNLNKLYGSRGEVTGMNKQVGHFLQQWVDQVANTTPNFQNDFLSRHIRLETKTFVDCDTNHGSRGYSQASTKIKILIQPLGNLHFSFSCPELF